MTSEFSSSHFMEFIDYTAKKGLVNVATASTRKAAAKALLEIAEPAELNDVRTINVDQLASRFANLRGSGFTPGSLNTYKSRFTSALSDFLEYKQNPLSFKPSLTARARRTNIKQKPKQDSNQSSQSGPISNNFSMATTSAGTEIIPIRIRENVVVQVAGLPADLTIAEANKVAKVIQAFALFGE